MVESNKGFIYTRENMLEEIKNRKEKGLSIKAKDVRKEDNRLYLRLVKDFGSWENLFTELGVLWEDVYGKKPNGYWTRSRVRREMMKRVIAGKGLNYGSLIESDSDLYNAMVSVYGSWERAVKDIGEDVVDHLDIKPSGYWTRDKVIDELKERKSKGLSLQPSAIRSDNSAWGNRLFDFFKDWEEIYHIIGENPEDHMHRRLEREWSPEKVVKELLKLREQGIEINATTVHRKDIQLYRNGLKYFGTWKDVLGDVNKEL